MMAETAGFTRIITLLYAAAHLSTASPVLCSALVVQPGQNVTLICNLTSSNDIAWFVLRSDQLQPLLTVTLNALGGHEQNYHGGDHRRRGSVTNGMVDLMILHVEEEDAGLYFCLGRREGDVRVSRVIHLDVHGASGGSAGLPCWSLGVCVLPALLVSFLLFILGLALCSGKPAVCCCRIKRPPASEDVSLHYSSLRHTEKPRHTCRGGRPGLVRAEVTYSTVAECKNKNRSHLP